VTIDGVLIDFSGTLFRLEIDESWLAEKHGAEQAQHLMRVLTAPVAPSTHLPPEMAQDWARRDLDPDVHQLVYTESLRLGGLDGPGEAESGYRRMLDPSSWQIYPDVRAALERLRDKNIPVAVVSNIAWDVRTSFDRFGVTDLVTEFVLSFQEGSVKPEEKIFRIACDRLDVDPKRALMIGDSLEADGGAAALGCQVEIVEPLPTVDRPTALLDALARHGL
jgi:HAD superfamily hydrolase (TIGR01509 family)